MTDELYALYKNDKDFREYVDKWCIIHNLSLHEAFEFKILREYARYIKEQKK